MSQVHMLDVVGLLLAVVTFGFLVSMAMSSGLRGTRGDAGVRPRLERRAIVTGLLAVVTTIVAVVTEDPIRVVMFAGLAAGMAGLTMMLRRRPL